MAITVKSEFSPADRYLYDFRLCTYERGWAQVDTKQDASYYGTWTNPERREIFNCCEGDAYLTTCDTVEDYQRAIRDLVKWHPDSGYWKGIDPGFGADMKQRFIDLGMSDLLH